MTEPSVGDHTFLNSTLSPILCVLIESSQESSLREARLQCVDILYALLTYFQSNLIFKISTTFYNIRTIQHLLL